MPPNHAEDKDILVRTYFFTLASGFRILRDSPSPQLQRLQGACQTGSLAEAEPILAEISPLLTGAIPTAAYMALYDCVRTAVEQQHRDLVRSMFRREGGFLPRRLLSVGVDAAFHQHDTAMLKVFIDCGWDANEAGDPEMSMRPLLRHAVDDADLRAFLLAHGASPNVPNHRGDTPLETAAQWSSVEVVREFLEHGGDPATDDSLILAAEVGRLDVAELLLERGADVNALLKEIPHPWGQRDRRSALQAAAALNHQHMVQWLKSHGATAGND